MASRQPGKIRVCIRARVAVRANTATEADTTLTMQHNADLVARLNALPPIKVANSDATTDRPRTVWRHPAERIRAAKQRRTRRLRKSQRRHRR